MRKIRKREFNDILLSLLNNSKWLEYTYFTCLSHNMRLDGLEILEITGREEDGVFVTQKFESRGFIDEPESITGGDQWV